jgi:multicomponent Na+:H+ antiporter subunit G
VVNEILSAGLLIVGAVFIFIAALGLVRMPDAFLRMSSSAKGATLGVGATLLAAALFFEDLTVAAQAIATIGFVMLTTPVATHMIARAAYFQGSPLWQNTQVDELCDRYDPATHRLEGRPCADPAAAPEETALSADSHAR